MLSPTLIAHLNRSPDHLAKLKAWDRTLEPWVGLTGSWWMAWTAEELRSAAEWVEGQK